MVLETFINVKASIELFSNRVSDHSGEVHEHEMRHKELGLAKSVGIDIAALYLWQGDACDERILRI